MAIDAFSPGTVLNERYEVLGKIDSGGFGSVYRVHDTEEDRVVALKLTTHLGEDAARFEREIRTLSRLGISGVVPILDFELQNNPPYYVMPLADATLERRGVEIRQDEGTILAVFRSICRPLIELHDQGLIHRDLKPANVLVLGDEYLIADFGLVKNLAGESITLTQAGIGSFEWCAPEQLTTDGTKNADARTDVHALGKILYWLYTGDSPLSPDLEVLPRGLRSIVSRAIRKKKEERFPDVSSMLLALDVYEEALGTEAVSSAAVRPMLVAIREGRRHAKGLIRRLWEDIEQKINCLKDEYVANLDDDVFLSVIGRTVPLAMRFAETADAVAEFENHEAAMALYRGFELIIKGYSLPPGVGGSYDLRWFDVHRFVGYELFVTMFAALLHEERWDLVAALLGEGLLVPNPNFATTLSVVPFVYVQDTVHTLVHRNRSQRLGRASLIADLMRERRTTGDLARLSPFDDFMEADYLLYLRALGEAEGQHPMWTPDSAVYLRQPPSFLVRSTHGRYGVNLFKPLGVATVDALRQLVTKAKNTRIMGDFIGHNCLHAFDPNAIPGMLP